MVPILNVYLVVTDKEGKVVHFQNVRQEEPDLDTFTKEVSRQQRELEEKYIRALYTVHVGVASNLGTLLQSFPEMKASKPSHDAATSHSGSKRIQAVHR